MSNIIQDPISSDILKKFYMHEIIQKPLLSI